jgi:hypothetical protein
MSCCGSTHPFDSAEVRSKWWPANPRCLIIGESPGRPGGDYFYDCLPDGEPDAVTVRANLLSGLVAVGLIRSATLESFRDAGFFFDHVIRCQLPLDQVAVERNRAATYISHRAKAAEHLKPFLTAFPKAWAMGNLARNAVVELWDDARPDLRRITAEPYPCVFPGLPTVFVSRYLTHIDADEVRRISEGFRRFLRQ